MQPPRVPPQQVHLHLTPPLHLSPPLHLAPLLLRHCKKQGGVHCDRHRQTFGTHDTRACLPVCSIKAHRVSTTRPQTTLPSGIPPCSPFPSNSSRAYWRKSSRDTASSTRMARTLNPSPSTQSTHAPLRKSINLPRTNPLPPQASKHSPFPLKATITRNSNPNNPRNPHHPPLYPLATAPPSSPATFPPKTASRTTKSSASAATSTAATAATSPPLTPSVGVAAATRSI